MASNSAFTIAWRSDIGIEKEAAARSALWVYFISLPLTLVAALKLFGVF